MSETGKRYAWCTDPEEGYHGDCASREEAVAEAIETHLEEGYDPVRPSEIWTGELAALPRGPKDRRLMYDADHIAEAVSESAYDDFGDESFPERADEQLQADVDAAVRSYIERVRPGFREILNTQKHEAPAAEVAN